MKGTIDEFQSRYREMSDDGLLTIEPGELIDAARQCYEEELAARGLTPPAPESEAEPAEESGPAGPLVCVAVFLLKREANLAQSVLESAEIPCFQPNRHMLDIDPALATAVLGGCQVFVPASYVEQARELLGPMIAEANKAIVRHWFEEVWNDGREDAAVEFGAGADKRLRSLLSDLHITVDDVVAEADKVASRITIQGTHKGASVQFRGVVFVRLEDGRIVETWNLNDAPASLGA